MSGEKTEQATPKKRKDERKKGNLLSSKDVITVVTMIGTFYTLKLTFPSTVEKIDGFFRRMYESASIASTYHTKDVLIRESFQDLAWTGAGILVPLAVVAMILGIAASVAQTKPVLVWDALQPKFSRMNPLEGIKRLFSFKSAFDVLKNIVKISILIAIVYNFVTGLIIEFSKMLYIEPTMSASITLGHVMSLVFKVCIAFIAISVADYFFQWWEYERKMKMSKQDIKEEYKKTEGDPQVKGKIKEIQRKMAMSRMMQSVPDADVIIKNPTHYAVALRYNLEKDTAPILLAKGQDAMALKIIEVGEEADVVVIENVALARAIYATTDVDREISPEFYGTIAEILVYVYKLKNKQLV